MCWHHSSESSAHVGDVSHMSVRLSILDNAAVVSFIFPRVVARHRVSVYCTLCTVRCTLYTVHCELCTVNCALYTVHCALYTVHCTL